MHLHSSRRRLCRQRAAVLSGSPTRVLAGAGDERRDADRDALLLFAWAELDYSEIARAMRVPVGTVRSRLHRARSRVRAYLNERSNDG